jgi:replication factor C subunit 2/4
MNNIPWVDKYRPRRIDSLIHQDEVKRVLKDTIKTGELPNLLFYGPPGSGKTSAIIALGYELFGPTLMNERILELNASDERGIDTVREKIITFAKESIGPGDPAYPSPPYKIIILDEADAITLDAQSALRKVIETSSKITRFCFTCNYIEKIIDPIISRCVKFRFKPINKKSMIFRLKQIAEKEKIKISEICLEKIFEISEGDARRSIMILQNTKYLYKYKNKIKLDDLNELVGSSKIEDLEYIWNEIIKNSISNLLKVTQFIKNQSINISELLIFIKDKIINYDIKDNIKSNLVQIIANTEGKILERADEYINILYLLSEINFNLAKLNLSELKFV